MKDSCLLEEFKKGIVEWIDSKGERSDVIRSLLDSVEVDPRIKPFLISPKVIERCLEWLNS